MNRFRKMMLGAGIWIAAISGLHATLNVDWSVIMNDQLPLDKRKLNVAYIPVT